MSDGGPFRQEDTIYGVASFGNTLEMTIESGRADPNGFIDDGLGQLVSFTILRMSQASSILPVDTVVSYPART